ncbi:SWIM zinc finger family protein [Calidifontibacillus erzurumensis]|uniref:SWIM-type domain-containing protein n=1 Tax=Calidifontibacillus erzurumensis TaxID=2741433 RepID=A0A8J8GG34_9BACI|nr:hypothetical protein [Calidifontibacillus erzurumensis]NSL51753.1 hypothetical protein [Calidifontibacillus erzurumensis]
MLVKKIPKKKIKSCIEDVFDSFDPTDIKDVKHVKRALSLFRNGAVYNVVVDEDTISAVVQDYKFKFHVNLEIDFFEISMCDCPEIDFYCTHKLAVLFYLFSLFDSPGKFFNRWKNGQHYFPAQTHAKTSTPLTKNNIRPKTVNRPYQEDSLESWIAYFNERYEEFTKQREATYSYMSFFQSYNLARDLFEIYYATLLDTPKPSSRFGEFLFQIHAAITVFEKILQTSFGVSYADTTQYLDKLISEIIDLIYISQKYVVECTEADEKIIDKTPERMLDILFITRDFQYERFYLFQFICTNFMFKPNILKNFIQNLETRSKKEEKLKKLGKGNFSSECRLALAHFDFIYENDEKAINRLSTGPSNEVYFYTTWFKSLAENKSWDRFKKWLPFIEKQMSAFIHEYEDHPLKSQLSSFYLFLIQEYADEIGDESVYIHTLQTWLPYSFFNFSSYLIEKKEYHMWTELMLYIGIPLENIDPKLIKAIESENRAALLPLYHNEIEECIAEKNRKAYQQAVKHLRKLRTYYRALKKEEKWNDYIHMLSTKYKRLRAFQEELRKGKGKLIDD